MVFGKGNLLIVILTAGLVFACKKNKELPPVDIDGSEGVHTDLKGWNYIGRAAVKTGTDDNTQSYFGSELLFATHHGSRADIVFNGYSRIKTMAGRWVREDKMHRVVFENDRTVLREQEIDIPENGAQEFHSTGITEGDLFGMSFEQLYNIRYKPSKSFLRTNFSGKAGWPRKIGLGADAFGTLYPSNSGGPFIYSWYGNSEHPVDVPHGNPVSVLVNADKTISFIGSYTFANSSANPSYIYFGASKNELFQAKFNSTTLTAYKADSLSSLSARQLTSDKLATIKYSEGFVNEGKLYAFIGWSNNAFTLIEGDTASKRIKHLSQFSYNGIEAYYNNMKALPGKPGTIVTGVSGNNTNGEIPVNMVYDGSSSYQLDMPVLKEADATAQYRFFIADKRLYMLIRHKGMFYFFFREF